jgi:hypothetical protein
MKKKTRDLIKKYNKKEKLYKKQLKKWKPKLDEKQMK